MTTRQPLGKLPVFILVTANRENSMGHRLRLASLFAILSLSCVPLLAAESPFPGIEALMTPAERAVTGVDALSPAELDALNDWLREYLSADKRAVPVVESLPAQVSPPPPLVATPPAIPAPAPAAVPATASADAATVTPETTREYGAPPPEFQPYTSRIKGQFNGWSGGTRFTLENGEVYEQRRPGRWRVNLMNPEVRISKNFLGAYDMEVVSEGRSIGVRRLR